jgi:hypothetical protein
MNMPYFRNTLLLVGFLFAGAFIAFLTAAMWVSQQRIKFADSGRSEFQARAERAAAEGEAKLREEQIQTLRDFVIAWEPGFHVASAKDLGNYLRNELARKATNHGLVSEGAVTPAETKNYPVGGTTIRVQQVSIKVVGDSLPSILSWLGSVERTFAIARVDSVTLSTYGSRSASLAITLLHPVEETPARMMPAVGGSN